jgi:hypothetical protein
VRVWAVVEEREENLDCSDAAVEAGCQRGLKLFLGFYEILVTNYND